MKRLVTCALFVLIGFAGISLVFAQTNNSEQEVRNALKEMIDGDLKSDADVLDRTTTEDFTITRDNGVVRSKAETLQGLRDGSTKFNSFEMSDIRVRLYGETAIVTFHESIKGTRGGKEMGGEFREVRVFVKRGGKWLATVAQRTRIAS